MAMTIEQVTDLGNDALAAPQKYNAFMGISIPHRFFSKKTMQYYFDWSAKQFKETVILLMDDPDKYNFIVFKKKTPDEALQKARLISDEIKRGYEKILKQQEITTIKILQFRDFIKEPAYIFILTTIKDYLRENEDFKKTLTNLMENSIGNKIQEFIMIEQVPQTQVSNLKEILFQYIVEEVASIIYLTEQSYLIELDPTIEFSTKKLLYENQFPELFKKLHLSQRGHIYIHPENIFKSTH